MALALLLAACGGKTTAPEAGIGYRNPTAHLGGTARFEAERFAGTWQTVACLGPCPASVNFSATLTGAVTRTAAGQSHNFQVDGPGILRGLGHDEILVVMWVDEGFRTAAIGDADGRGAMIIDKSAAPGADRVVAAREILDFYGWDVSRLKRMQ
ncbi:MAG: hypothetical protein ACSHWZ_05140 [Sulfitobacter sp.]